MKFDMAGAAATIGIIKTASILKPATEIIGIIPAVENMPGGNAVKPGDIIKAYNGKTVEILNTDAEGRLILADAMAYAIERFKPDLLIDFATLTGSILAALGDKMAKPTKKFQAGRVSCALWENEISVNGTAKAVLKGIGNA